MEDQKILQFIEWLGANVPELKGQSAEQIMTTLNQLAENPEGQKMLEGLIKQFEASSNQMFKEGGKLNYLLCLKKGGNIQDCGCGKKIDKAAKGKKFKVGDITFGEGDYTHATRRDMLAAGDEFYGADNRNYTNAAYQNALNAYRKQGLKGRELRQAARYMLIDSARNKTRGLYPGSSQKAAPVTNPVTNPVNAPVSLTENPEVMVGAKHISADPLNPFITPQLMSVPWQTNLNIPTQFRFDAQEYVPVSSDWRPSAAHGKSNFNNMFRASKQLGIKNFWYYDPGHYQSNARGFRLISVK